MKKRATTTSMDIREWSVLDSSTSAKTSPALVIGLGEFGRATLQSLHLGSRLQSSFTSLIPIWAAPGGWRFDWPDEDTGPEEYPEPKIWLQEHMQQSIRQFRQAVIEAWRADQNNLSPKITAQNTLDIFILVNLQESFGRELLQPVIMACRKAHSTFSDYVFTLILTFDSLALPQLNPVDAKKIGSSLQIISEELLSSLDESEPAGRIGWCYLLDSLDTLALPLTTPNDLSNQSFAIQKLHADVASGFISLVVAGLRHIPAYERTSIVNIRRAFRDLPPTPWASSLGTGSYYLPIKGIADSAAHELAYRLLSNIIIGQDQPGDLPAARKLRSRWLAECTLSPSDLRSRIGRDLGGQPLEFPVEPPSLDAIPDELIINHLLNWDTLLWQRWNRQDSPKERMANNAKSVIEEANTWLKRELEKLGQIIIGGTPIGQIFVGEAERALDDERQKPDGRHYAGNDAHWLKALLAPLLARTPDPTALPDLDASRRRLEKALRHRLNRRAVWVRASLFAAALTSFTWAAYSLCGIAIEQALLESSSWVGMLIHWLQRIPSPVISLLLILLTCWLLTLSSYGTYLFYREKAIHNAVDNMITDIRQKYSALIEIALRTEREKVYASLRAILGEWTKLIETRRSILGEAANRLLQKIENNSILFSLKSEKVLLSASDWPDFYPELDQATLRIYGENFLNSPKRLLWTEETLEQLLLSLHTFSEIEHSEWLRHLDLETWLSRPGSTQTISIFLDELRLLIRPAWPLSRDRRSEIGIQLHRLTSSTQSDQSASPVLSTNFVGLPARANGDKPSIPYLNSREEIFCTGDPGKLAYVATLHALDLKRLPVWEALKSIVEENSSVPSFNENEHEENEKI